MQSRKSVFVIAGVVAIVAAVGALLIAGVGSATADEVRFQNVSEPGPNPFTAPTDVAKTATGGTDTTSTATPSSTGTSPTESPGSTTESTESTGSSEPAGSSGSGSSDSSAAGPSSEGDSEPKEGTFGGTGSNTVCDREKLITELSQDPDRLSAWADVAGVEATEEAVGEYIRSLTPSTLTEDTQVTNHSFVNGEAQPYQAILKKGTAVLVDDDGKPVARCRCGNPLTEPLQLEQETKCINCPANYTPPEPCEGRCHEPEPDPPPVTGGGGTGGTGTKTPPPTDDIKSAKDALDACRKSKGSIEACRTEYEKARELCAANPLNAACDSTVCFEAAIDVASNGCPTYLDRGVALEVCLKIPGQAEKNACLKRFDDLAKKCTVDPQAAECKKDPKIKRVNLIGKCITTPSRPECAALQLDCESNPTQFRCDALRGACTNDPNRPDCKAAAQLKSACQKDPNKPECKAVPKKAAPTLAPEDEQKEETTEDPGTEETPDAGTEGETTDPGTGGGETPSTGGGEGTGETPEPESGTPAE